MQYETKNTAYQLKLMLYVCISDISRYDINLYCVSITVVTPILNLCKEMFRHRFFLDS